MHRSRHRFQLMASGCRVTITARDVDEGRDAAAGLGAAFSRLDLSEPDRSFDQMTRIGGFDILVNNAGIESRASLLEPHSDFTTAMEVMVNAPLDLIRLNVPHWRRTGWGRIVNVSSDGGAHAAGLHGPGATGIAHAALNALTRVLPRDLPPGVKINALDPGPRPRRSGAPGAAQPPDQGVETAVWLATLPEDGPTGGFFQDRQPRDW